MAGTHASGEAFLRTLESEDNGAGGRAPRVKRGEKNHATPLNAASPYARPPVQSARAQAADEEQRTARTGGIFGTISAVASYVMKSWYHSGGGNDDDADNDAGRGMAAPAAPTATTTPIQTTTSPSPTVRISLSARMSSHTIPTHAAVVTLPFGNAVMLTV